MEGIVPLLQALRTGVLSPENCLYGLEQAIAHCQQQQKALTHTRIQPQDQAEWEQTLLPGLLACLEAVAGVAQEARAYVTERKPQILENIVQMLARIDQASQLLEARLGTVSQPVRALTQELLQNLNADLLQCKPAATGSARTNLSLFDTL